MATLYKKPNSPFYYAQYFNADGKRVRELTNAGVIDDPIGFIGDIPICRVLF